MKKIKKYANGGGLFLTMPIGGSVPMGPNPFGQLPQYQSGASAMVGDNGIIQRTIQDLDHYYGGRYPIMAEGGDMEDESGATDSFYTNKVNGFIDKVRGRAQENLEKNLLQEAMRESRGDDETKEYSEEEMIMAARGMNFNPDYNSTYDPGNLNLFLKAYQAAPGINKGFQDFAKMNRIIQPTTTYQKVKHKFDLGLSDKFKEVNKEWLNRDGDTYDYSFEEGGTLLPMFKGKPGSSTYDAAVEEWMKGDPDDGGAISPEEQAYLAGLSTKHKREIFNAMNTGVGAGKTNSEIIRAYSLQHPSYGKISSGTTTQTGSANNTQVGTTGGNKTITQPAPGAGTTTTTGAGAGNTTTTTGSGTTTSGAGTTTSGTGTTTNTGTTTTTTDGASTNPFEGFTWYTDENGNKFIVTKDGQMYSPYQGGATSESVYTPWTPYGTTNTGKSTYGISERNKLTPEFRKAMLSGRLNDIPLLGLPEIEYRKALFPKNRNKEVKSITWNYGKLAGNPFADQAAGTTPGTQTAPGTSTTTPGVTTPKIDSPAVQSGYDWTFRPGQGGYPPSGGWQDMPAEGPINPNAGAGPLATPGADEPGFQSGYVPGSPEYPNVPGYTNKIPDFNTILGVDPGFNPGQVLNPDSRNTDPGFNPDANSGKNMDPGFKIDPAIQESIDKLRGAQQTGYNPPAYDMNRTFGQISDNEQKYFATEGNLNNPDWRSQSLENWGGKAYDSANKVATRWSGIKDSPVNPGNPKGLTKEDVLNQYDKLPAPIKEIATDHLFNASSDPRIFTLAAAGAIDMKDSAKYKNDPKLLEDTWAKNIDLINQQYNDDPQAFTSTVSDYRKLIYRKSRQKDDQFGNPTDLPSTSGTPGLQYNAWAGRTGNTQDYIDQTYFNPNTGYVPPRYFQKQGGSLDKFIKGYQGGGGVDWEALQDQFNEDVDAGLADIGPIDPNTMQPLKMPNTTMTDQDRINVIDSGTEYEKTGEEPNTWFIDSPYNVKDKLSRKKKKRDPWKAIRNINLAKSFFSQDERANADKQLREATQASRRFTDVPNDWGDYNVGTGKYMGPEGAREYNANLNRVYNTMGNYMMQDGGSLYDSLKMGDEIYLTQGQIDELLKRGVKLSYLD